MEYSFLLLASCQSEAFKIEDVDTYEGSIKGDTFCDFVQRCLVPILQPFDGTNDRSVVVRDG